MNISGYDFLLRFLPVFIIIYYLSPAAYRKAVLTIGSLIFYSFSSIPHMILLLAVGLANYGLSLFIKDYNHFKEFHEATDSVRSSEETLIYVISLFLNIGLLLICKLTPVFSPMPLGVSFYTFRMIGAMTDIYNKKVKAPDKLLDFLAYLCCFPLISMGPVTSYKNTDLALKNKELKIENIEDGLKYLAIGLSSKVLLADRIGILYTEVRTIGFLSVSTPLAWLCALAYSFRLYFDFAGYSFMAMGLMRIIGEDIPDNFLSPYASKSVSEFWRRWHISLGAWFREYVYIPLGGSKCGHLKTIRNLFIVWALTSFWHGISVNFMFWGLFIFILIICEKYFLKKILDKSKIGPHVYMALVIPISWAFFSVTNIRELVIYIFKLFPFLSISFLKQGLEIVGLNSLADFADPSAAKTMAGAIPFLIRYAPYFVLSLIFSIPYPRRWFEKYKSHPACLIMLTIGTALCLYRIGLSTANPFMYFAF